MKRRSTSIACAAVLVLGMTGCQSKTSADKGGVDATLFDDNASYNFSCADWGTNNSSSETASVDNSQAESC